MMPKLTILYRLCDRVEMLHGTNQEPGYMENQHSPRYYDVPKTTLIAKCLSSLKDNIDTISSMGNGTQTIAIEFICVYDNCSDEMLKYVKYLMPEAKMVCSNGSGNGNSFATCVDVANDMADDDTMVLFIEDDYSFLSKDGLNKGIWMLDTMKKRCGKWCAIFLDDYPDRYDENGFRRCTDVAVTPYGHLMRIDSSTCSFMTYVGAVKENYDSLIKFKNYPNVMEDGSINEMWKKVDLYSPLPAITLHCQLKGHIPQYMNAELLKRMMES